MDVRVGVGGRGREPVGGAVISRRNLRASLRIPLSTASGIEFLADISQLIWGFAKERNLPCFLGGNPPKITI